MAEQSEYISIRGASSHNLKAVDVDIPRGKLTVITGLSGSGKSSLAFDTIYAEGQRRYLNTLSPYARHFIGVLEKPRVESIEGLSPIIAIEQKTTLSNPRSTVGTITEIYDFLRLLFAKASTAYSPVTGEPMVRYSDSKIVDLILEKYHGRKCMLLSPLVRGRKGHYRELFDSLRRKAYTQVLVDGEIRDLADVDELDRYKNHNIYLVVDKLKPDSSDLSRVRSSVQTALDMGKGSVAMYDPLDGSMKHFSKHLVDPQTGLSLQEPAPNSFSFNSPEGYCPHCKGLGMIPDLSIETIIPDPSKSIAEGAIVPLGRLRDSRKYEIVRSISRKKGFSLYDPVGTIPDDALSLLLYGSDEYFRIGDGGMSEMVTWEGVAGDVDRMVVCPVCHGTRLRPEASYFRIDGKTISQVSEMEISALKEWVDSLPAKLEGRAAAVSGDILKELSERVGFLVDVGLDYLTLSRPSSTLSGGESQRIRLATQIGSRLVNVIYILDEPSIGLHQRDNRKLISSLKSLRDEGNTVIVVEHDEQTMLAADWIVEVGPLAGENGGRICYSGPPREVHSFVPVPSSRRSGNGKKLIIRGASGNNLKNIDVTIPLGMMVGLCGVSGSGKSTLITQTLLPILKNRFYHTSQKPLPYTSIEGLEGIDKVIEIDQSPIGRSPRSNPATFTGVFSDIRDLFAQTQDAKVRGFKAGRFSFNVEGGRCEDCKGAGIKLIEMNFLPSVSVVCESCAGKRYKEDTLAVRYKGKNISEVLDMPAEEAYEFFKSNPRIAPKLKALIDVGLGYITLGQSSVSLSGGECQRMKLAAELSRKATGNTLYLLDEPTTGLHSKDIRTLMQVLSLLVDQGNTVLIVEHNPDVLKCMDYLIDLGTDGGEKGGRVVAAGTPEALAANPDSVTGPFLREALG